MRKLLQLVLPCLREDQIKCLNDPLTRTEVTATLFAMHLKKAPDLDGYTEGFYQQQWALLGEDV